MADLRQLEGCWL